MIHSLNSIFAEIVNLSEADLLVLSYIKICYVCHQRDDLTDGVDLTDAYDKQSKYTKFLNKEDIKDAFSKKIIKEGLLKYHNISYFFGFGVLSDFHQENIISSYNIFKQLKKK